MTVLVLAAEHDVSADQVQHVLAERAVPVIRINTAWFPTRLGFSAELSGAARLATDEAPPVPQAWRTRLRGHTPPPDLNLDPDVDAVAGLNDDLDAVRSVWFRGPEAYRMPEGLSQAEAHHAAMEAKYGLGGVLASIDALWANHPARTAEAAYKPWQLSTASRCGLTVPETLISNDPQTVREFCARGPTVTKLIGASTIYEENQRKIGYTRLIEPTDLDDLRGISTTTHLFQRWIPKAYEVRVLVIGQNMTAAAIRAGSAASYVDWRTDYPSLSYELITPPDAIVDGVLSVMNAFGLTYGAFDFVVSPDNFWTFLEINPAGQYGWIESRTGAPLTAQLADLLSKGAT